MLTLEHQIKLSKLFDEYGNVKGYFDPHCEDLTKEPYSLIFDNESKQVLEEVDKWFHNFIGNNVNKVGIYSTMVKLIYANDFGANTKGSYPAIYAWR